MDHVLLGQATLMKGTVHHMCTHEIVQSPAHDAVEMGHEVLEGISTGPKGTTTIVEKRIPNRK